MNPGSRLRLVRDDENNVIPAQAGIQGTGHLNAGYSRSNQVVIARRPQADVAISILMASIGVEIATAAAQPRNDNVE
ncbi:MAG: hypothetical protein R3179_10705, partial [Sedimenticolaceae bacterium]|nr:hypothetical protein [Sedimenticolaceae bacterium]